MHLLFVEDNDQDAFLVRQALDQLDQELSLDIVPDAPSAMDYLHRRPPYETAAIPDLILLDLNLPGPNGYDLLQEIRSDQELRHLVVLIFSTSDLDDDVRRGFEQGANSYLVKPGSFKELRQLLADAVRYWTRVSRRAARPA